MAPETPLPNVITGKPHYQISLSFYRQKQKVNVKHFGEKIIRSLVIKNGQTVPIGQKEFLVQLRNIHVQDLQEAHAFAREFIIVNQKGIWQTPEPYDFFYDIQNMGVANVSVREKMDGTDGENGVARRRGENPLPGTQQ